MSIVNSASLNYLRIGALGFGAWYGFTRQFSLEKLVVTNKLKAEAHQHELLIEEARVAHEAWENKKEATDGAKENSTHYNNF